MHLLEKGGCDGNEELRGVGGLQDGTPGVGDQACALAGSLDVIELLLHIVHTPNIPQHLPVGVQASSVICSQILTRRACSLAVLMSLNSSSTLPTPQNSRRTYSQCSG